MPPPDDPAALPSLVDVGRRPLGPDLTVGPLAFGCWRFVDTDMAAGRELVETALDLDMDLVDTADIYGQGFGGSGFGAAEERLGAILAEAPSLRERMVLVTKGGIRPGVGYDSSADHLVAACEASLRRLGVEAVDCYLVRRPDLLGHPAQVAEALDTLVTAGKVRTVGVSNHTPAQTEALAYHLAAPVVATQPELSAAHLAPLRDGTGDLAMREGHAVLAWSPLAGGRLAGGPLGGGDVPGVRPELLALLDELAEREEADRAAVALAFVLALPFRPVAICGTQTPERLHDAQRALAVRLDRSDCYRIIEAAEGAPLP
ncbi:aldo/keto reductase [soil metagenome]